MNKNDMNLIRKMNNYIKHQEENKCEYNNCNNNNRVNDTVDAFNYLLEWFPQFKNSNWETLTKDALENLSKNKPMFDEELFKDFYKPEIYKTNVPEPKWETTMTKNVKYVDYGRNVNVLYAQLCLLIQEVCSVLMLGDEISQVHWENLSRKMMQAYNYAAYDTDYSMDVNKSEK